MKICEYLRLHIKIICWRLHNKVPFYFLRYTHGRFVSLFTNIRKRWNTLKISLVHKKFTNWIFWVLFLWTQTYRESFKSALICIIVPLNFRAVSKMRYGAGIIELQAMDRKTRKLLTMNGASITLTITRRMRWKDFTWKDQGRGRCLIGVEDCVSVEIHSLKDYLMRTAEKLLEYVENNGLLGNRNT